MKSLSLRRRRRRRRRRRFYIWYMGTAGIRAGIFSGFNETRGREFVRETQAWRRGSKNGGGFLICFLDGCWKSRASKFYEISSFPPHFRLAKTGKKIATLPSAKKAGGFRGLKN